MSFNLQIPRSVYDAMIAHAAGARPNECVGLLAGQATGLVTERYPLINAVASPTRFESDPRSLLRAEKRRREQGLTLLAIYHSHPNSPPIPSKVDLDPEVNFWLDAPVVSLIIGLSRGEAVTKGYWLRVGGYDEAAWSILNDE